MTRTEGFTLVELLVAVAILSIIGVMALSGLTQAIN
ncbi:MAG TPA: prepilin-type N-terminal cleavage/methylation domain-containing protein, partial [Alphaproteobacteria bacterium]|nr:prepilin-type N-terminal cleavage/methylation domain-containing protein [Alphaproteobacteria bacterium]